MLRIPTLAFLLSSTRTGFELTSFKWNQHHREWISKIKRFSIKRQTKNTIFQNINIIFWEQTSSFQNLRRVVSLYRSHISVQFDKNIIFSPKCSILAQKHHSKAVQRLMSTCSSNICNFNHPKCERRATKHHKTQPVIVFQRPCKNNVSSTFIIWREHSLSHTTQHTRAHTGAHSNSQWRDKTAMRVTKYRDLTHACKWWPLAYCSQTHIIHQEYGTWF